MRGADLHDLNVAEIMSRWPSTIRVFLSQRLHCVGCPISPFHTLVEAAEEHEISLDCLMEEVTAAVDSTLDVGRANELS